PHFKVWFQSAGEPINITDLELDFDSRFRERSWSVFCWHRVKIKDLCCTSNQEILHISMISWLHAYCLVRDYLTAKSTVSDSWN
ncbi:hypothetical protein LSH36_406g01026, partial [Paralvinella palmiformis]